MILFIAASVTGSDVLAHDVQALAPGSIVELFELDLTPFGGELLRFHAGTNDLLANLTWNGEVYTAFPVAASGFEFNGQGQAPRPKMMVSNVVGSITALVLQYDDLVGAKVTRRRTLVKYLDAVNFSTRRNLLLLTNSLTGTEWLKNRVAVAADATVDPTGGSGAFFLSEDTQTGAHHVSNSTSRLASVTDDQTITLSAFVKPGTREVVALSLFRRDGTFCNARFDLTAKSLVSVSSGYTATIEEVENGWLRISLTGSVLAGVNSPRHHLFLDNGTTTAYTGDGVSGLYVYGPQAEIGSTLSEYQEVGATWNDNPAADPTAEFPADIYYIDRKSVETNEIVEFELGPAMDVTGVMLPRRQIIQNICPWKYRSSECGYTGTNYFDANDVSVGSLALDVCGKRLGSCKTRFGLYAELPFGGFPVAGLFR